MMSYNVEIKYYGIKFRGCYTTPGSVRKSQGSPLRNAACWLLAVCGLVLLWTELPDEKQRLNSFLKHHITFISLPAVLVPGPGLGSPWPMLRHHCMPERHYGSQPPGSTTHPPSANELSTLTASRRWESVLSLEASREHSRMLSTRARFSMIRSGGDPQP